MKAKLFTVFLLLTALVTLGCGKDEEIASLKEDKEKLERELKESEDDVDKLEATIDELEEQLAALERREEEKKEKQATTDIYDLKDYKINLSGSGGSRLLLFSAAAEGTPDAIAALEQKEPQIRDAVILLASDYTVLELEGLDGKLRLRDDIHRRINSILAPHKVLRVYFTTFMFAS